VEQAPPYDNLYSSAQRSFVGAQDDKKLDGRTPSGCCAGSIPTGNKNPMDGRPEDLVLIIQKRFTSVVGYVHIDDNLDLPGGRDGDVAADCHTMIFGEMVKQVM